MKDSDAKIREVRRLLDRYITEIVENYDICPWARHARSRGAIAAEVLWGIPSLQQWIDCSCAVLARPRTEVAMIVAPELSGAPSELRHIRDAVAARVTTAGIADFHPHAALDLATPSRLVPYLRRSPDPMLQLISFTRLDEARGRPVPAVARSAQAQMLGGVAMPQPVATSDRIAQLNHERVQRDQDRIAAVFADIHADRDRSYARVGIRMQKS